MSLLRSRFKERLDALWCIHRPDCYSRLRVNSALPLVVTGLALAWFLYSPRFESSILLFALLGTVGMTYAWARALMVGMKGTRRLEYSAFQVGDELEEQIRLENTSSFPVLWVEFIDRSDLPGYLLSGVRGVGGHSHYEWRVHTICTRRGVYRLGPWELCTSDPFGIFGVVQEYFQPLEVLVVPPLASIPGAILPPPPAVGDHRSPNKPVDSASLNLFSIRRYQPGDPLRRVHWRTSARRDSLYIKMFEPEAASTVWIVPDLDRAAHHGEGEEASLEKLIILAASLAGQLLRSRRSVGLFIPGSPPNVVSPGRNQGQLWPILRALAPLTLQPCTLAQTLEEAETVLSLHSLMIVLTSSLDPAWPLQLRHRAGRGKGSAEVVLLDPSSFGGPAGAADFSTALVRSGIPSQVVSGSQIKPVEGSYGQVSRWEFKTLGLGRVLARHMPRRSIPAPAGEGSHGG